MIHEDGAHPGDWRVENLDNDGVTCHVAAFSGPLRTTMGHLNLWRLPIYNALLAERSICEARNRPGGAGAGAVFVSLRQASLLDRSKEIAKAIRDKPISRKRRS